MQQQPKQVAEKIVYLTELMKNSDRNEGSALRIFHELFQLTHEGRDLPPATAEWLSEAASFFLSPQLLKVLFKLRLQVYGFQFAALNLTDVDDVVDDLTNGEILKSINSLPPGAYIKLKRELLELEQAKKRKPNEEQLSEENPLLVNFLSGNNTSTIMKSLKHLVNNDRQFSFMPSESDDNDEAPRNLNKRKRVTTTPERSQHQLRLSQSVSNFNQTSSPSGKSTLINAMVNYILGVEWDDPFRFLLIDEEENSSLPNSQAHSQTSKVTAYELHYQVGFRVPYSLIIVDTPGYGDTKGIERDIQITDSIQHFFKDEKGIQVSRNWRQQFKLNLHC